MGHKIFSTVCKCWHKIYCVCIDVLSIPYAKNDLEEWRRIEGIDQYIKKRL